MTHRSWLDAQGRLQSQPTLTLEEIPGGGRRGARLGAEGRVPRVRRVGMRRALDGGCDSIEHGLDLDDAASRRW